MIPSAKIIAFLLMVVMAFLPTVADIYIDPDLKLFNAAQKGDIQLIKELMGKGADINVKLGADQWTPLMTASREGKLEAVNYFLEQGADPKNHLEEFVQLFY